MAGSSTATATSTTASARRSRKVFSPSGTYTVALKVTDDGGATSIKSKDVVVANRQPTADFDFSPAAPKKNEPVTFTSLASDPENRIQILEWDLDGDNQLRRRLRPDARTKSFDSPGSKTVRLRITDSDGGSHTAAKTLTVASQPPAASFAFSPDAPLSLQRVVFTSTSTDPDGAIVDVRWDTDNDGAFDDGNDIEADAHVRHARHQDCAPARHRRRRQPGHDHAHGARRQPRADGDHRRPDRGAEERPTSPSSRSRRIVDGSIAKTEWDTDGDGYRRRNRHPGQRSRSRPSARRRSACA